MSITARDIAAMIDHSLLRPELTVDEVRAGCRLAAQYEVASVCVRPSDVPIAREILAGTPVRVTTVIGFPHGSHTSEVKVFEAQQAIVAGAVELDMVLNIGRLRSGDEEYVERDIRVVADTAHEHGVIVKVIFENCYLDDEQKKTACRLAERAGADFVKTSTGFASGGATLEDLRLMRACVGEKVQVKAAGGVRTLGAALAVRRAGVTRFGATATREIMNDARAREAAGTLDAATGAIGDSY